ncbi:MAG: GtrA family protein, partial [Kiritimatiellae bacterium]|nr:GtrA family protein [Kiritimatiellia bacterium]
LQFCLSSILSFALDYAVFIGLLAYLGGRENELSPHEELLLSTVVARFVSSNFNYFYNRFVVFRTKGRKRSFFQYFGLVVVIWALSYGLTDGLCTLLRIRGLSMTLIKVAVDVFLFLTSYWVQKKFIFRSRAA